MKKRVSKQRLAADRKHDTFTTGAETDQDHRQAWRAAMFKLSRIAFCFCLMTILLWGMTSQLQAYDKKQYARALRFKKCIKCDLYKANFAGIDLSYADFTGSNLILASFQKATLYQVNFEEANLSGANFEGALWVNGKICQENSYGKCNFLEQN
jgi:hypothetical protein